LWISYFNGGEAIHGFNRATYGFPQSVGCVEASNDDAGKIWPYTPIGTLVTVTT
jgi:lipoprotein-anchoring transpeptidase ErfK/SrfK